MTKKSLALALNAIDEKNSKPKEFLITQRTSKKLIVEIPIEAHMQIEQMKLDLRKDSIKNIVIEAINDMFKKHGYIPIA
jgi:hypothetical protein